MSRLVRPVLLLALAVSLILIVPAGAAAPDHSGETLSGPAGWLGKLWESVVRWFAPSADGGGPYIDPNGASTPLSGGPDIDPNGASAAPEDGSQSGGQSEADGGPHIDPDG